MRPPRIPDGLADKLDRAKDELRHAIYRTPHSNCVELMNAYAEVHVAERRLFDALKKAAGLS